MRRLTTPSGRNGARLRRVPFHPGRGTRLHCMSFTSEFDVMICFPQLVSTGLDLFSKEQGGHNFNCIVFYETGYKLNMMRQAARRAFRLKPRLYDRH